MKSIFKAIALVLFSFTFFTACTPVPSGHVGVKVNMYGGSKGVDITELSPGKYWIGINEELHLFPTFTQTDNWAGSQRITFQTKEGLTVTGEVGASFYVKADKASVVFQKYRKGMGEISDLYLRNLVQDTLVKKAGGLEIESVYGAGKTDLLEQAHKLVAAEMDPLGIVVEKLYWIGNLGLPESVVKSINAKIAATQMAQQRENEVRQAEAEAAKDVAAAKGVADSILLKAEAQAKANKLLSDSITDRLVQYELVKTWDGVGPVVAGPNGTILDLNGVMKK